MHRFKKLFLFSTMFLLFFTLLAGCKNSAADNSKTLSVVFIPNDSVKEVEPARKALSQKISKATGKKVKIQTTTDYNIAIQAISSGKAQIALLGADGYIQAHKQNNKVVPILTYSGKSGTLKDAYYHSYIMVKKNKEQNYLTNGKYDLNKVKGKRMSFVANTSTSGFAIPAGALKTKFNLKSTDQLSQSGQFFSKVVFGGSHQGSALNLMKDDVDVAAFDDHDLTPYGSFSSTDTKPGITFTVKQNAPAPFNTVPNQVSVALAAYKVQSEPIVVNRAKVSQTDVKKIQKALTANSVSQDTHFFAPSNAKTRGLFTKDGKTRFIAVDDSWYKPTHKILGE
ncbi:phosphate/phosphite/phosphonate ABC transporter substrate-binding protein [Liquorilactobacillus satsumensis]|nr:phosphate/phosphite/phosphonate ABC transporter substrate-binding protein [Liquorilactobacillus satsumensis]MCC7667754.1 phosphonate ABC transporter substrate-binding protein [Liquorilactobacillus satsumensis]MCP9356915.1 phosphate/phosphite/phosphonate ABC transporter substrate-binding protein [Liquorilactobacillus satsumensis]MCP9370862.1 phosphate/phosphite/phosphonate ABC transporter substrate-binding protein [Liquorilactobacillus satsumensis]